MTLTADATDPAALAAAVVRTGAALGPLTIAINAPGIANAAPAGVIRLTRSLAMEWVGRVWPRR